MCVLLLSFRSFFLSFFLITLFIYFWLSWVFVVVRGLSLVEASWELLFVAVCGFLLAVAFLCCGARALGTQASVVVARRFSSCGAWA